MDAAARRTRLTGVGLALLSAASFGVMPVLTKVAYADGADAVGVLSVRFTLAGLVLLVLARLRGEPLPRGRTLVALSLLGGVLYVAQSLCYFLALERVSASLTALLLYFFPALVVLLSAVLLRVRPRPGAVACVAVATAGTAMTLGPLGSVEVLGVALGLASATAYATYIVLSGQVVDDDAGPFATSAVVILACAAGYDVLALATGAAVPSAASAWLALVGVALVGTVVAVAAFFAALPRLGAPDTAVVSTLEPVVTVAAAALVLGERLSALQLSGGVLVLAAVVVLARLDPRTATDEHEVPA
jgi:drug/metabolite transporter (DMT)-like permease